jgi:chromosome segregation protein
MFGGGRAKLKIKNQISNIKNNGKLENGQEETGIEIELNLPRRRLTSLEMLSGGEKTLVSLAALFALISINPPPFLVLDEIDSALDDRNAQRFAELIKRFSQKTQFVVVTHNRSTMNMADVLYGITMSEDGVSKVLSLKLDTKT